MLLFARRSGARADRSFSRQAVHDLLEQSGHAERAEKT